MAKQHAPGFGIEYEILVPAYFALTLHQNPTVKAYSIRSNVPEFGNIDDVVVDITTTDESTHRFAIQLKHKENRSTKLLPTNFEAKGDFCLEKYHKAFNTIDAQNQHCHFILYTNREFNPCSKQQLKHFRMVEDRCFGEAFFNTGVESESVYRFEVNDETVKDYGRFLERFRVYVGQKGFKGLKEEIFDKMDRNEHAMLSYLEVFRTWHQNGYTNKVMDQTTVNFHLVDIFLDSFTITGVQLSRKGDHKLELFETIVRQFDVTIIDDNIVEVLPKCDDEEISEHTTQILRWYKEEYKLEVTDQDDIDDTMLVYMLYLGKKYKFLDRYFTKDRLALDTRKKNQFLHYFFDKPLLLEWCESSARNFDHAMTLYRNDGKNVKFVLVGQGVDVTKLSKFTIFENLNDLSKSSAEYAEIVKTCTLSLQNKDKIVLEDLLSCLGSVDFIRVKELFLMLCDNFVIGDDTEVLPLNHIPRRISIFVLKQESLLKRNFLFKNNIFVIDFGGKFEELREVFEDNDIPVFELPGFFRLTTLPQKSVVIPLDDECPLDTFEQIRVKTKSKNLFYLKMIDFDTFIPVVLENTDPAFFSEIDVDEKEIHNYCDTTVNVLCAQAGMGKSTLCKSLHKQLPNFWTVIVDLKAHNGFLKEKHFIDDVLHHLLTITGNNFLDNTKTAFLRAKKVVFFLDGLDELDSTCIDTLLAYAKKLSALGLRVWIFSRQNLEAGLITYFKKFTVKLTEVDRNEQIHYIKNRLRSKSYRDDEVQTVIGKIFNSTEVVNNRQVLGIPLQLYIITQIFLDDEDKFKSTADNIFVLTKMYRLFFDGRYKHTVSKQEAKNPHIVVGEAEDYFEKYEILALVTILDDVVFRELNLDLRRTRRFLDEIKRTRDPLGIVVHVNSENKAVFEHQTYAEYFACMFFSYNFDKVRVLKQHLFSDRYKNLLLILNIMLAEESPLHLGVIYMDLQQIERHCGGGKVYDRAGRNPLHLAACRGMEYPNWSVFDCFFHTSRFLRFIEEVITSRRIVSFVLESDPLERDELFSWNCLDYANQTSSLYAMEMILQKYPTTKEITKNAPFVPDINLPLFLVITGSSNLLATMNHPLVKSLPKLTLHMTIMYCCFNKMEMLTFLIQNGADLEYSYKGNTALQLATRMKKLTIVTLLTKWGAKSDVVAQNGDTILHCAVRSETFEHELCFSGDVRELLGDTTTGELYLNKCSSIDLVGFFLDKGVSINSQNNDGETPLHVAALNADFDVCELLCANNADVNIVTTRKMSVLHYAVLGGDVQVVAFVASKIVDVDIENDNGETALVVAIKMKNFKIAEFLYDTGARVCVDRVHREWIWCLFETGECDVEFIKSAVSSGVLGVNALGRNGVTLIHVAAKTDLELTKFLYEKGADVDCLTYNGVHAIQLAVYSGKVDIVEFLWEKADLMRVVKDHKVYPLVFATEGHCLYRNLLLKGAAMVQSLEDKRLYNVRRALRTEFLKNK
ncbi:uncharacterized protein LOC135140269 [Zophobas morio]|uniref:uncharacterized protein LOC135140269 n=1 Tax=Zophobas morio TaxID=2755281 RepID=UPI003082F67D